MLYKLRDLKGKKKDLTAMPFLDFGDLQKLEKDLEILLSDNLLEVLFEDARLMPIFQERQLQAEADLYALNQSGDLIIFELKRGIADDAAMHQILWYAQEAGKWTHKKLEDNFHKFSIKKGNSIKPLKEAHLEAFQLEHPLLESQFNNKQQLIIVGSAANDNLIKAVDYWKKQGLWVDFLPYRIYKLDDEYYFEFFSIPYDKHHNPATRKGVIFDTNRSYDEEAVWEMMENSRVAAYGDAKQFVGYLSFKDIVFFSHKWMGIIAAGEVIGPVRDNGDNEKYRDVKLLTPIPIKSKGIIKFMPFSQVSIVTGKSFYWARTIKVPYLNIEESITLINELNNILK